MSSFIFILVAGSFFILLSEADSALFVILFVIVTALALSTCGSYS